MSKPSWKAMPLSFPLYNFGLTKVPFQSSSLNSVNPREGFMENLSMKEMLFEIVHNQTLEKECF